MVIETGKPIAVVARKLGIHNRTLGNSVGRRRREHPEPDQPLNPWSVPACRKWKKRSAGCGCGEHILKKAAEISPGRTRSGEVPR